MSSKIVNGVRDVSCEGFYYSWRCIYGLINQTYLFSILEMINTATLLFVLQILSKTHLVWYLTR
jgi:hypothetical protein